MNSSSQIIVSLTSFGASEVRRHGQRWFIELCKAAGADGVEIRGELLQGRDDELNELAASIRSTGLRSVYSCPDMLWDADGWLNLTALDRSLSIAVVLQARVLKMSIGAFGNAAPDTFEVLKQRLAAQDVTLLIENDQRASAGAVDSLQRFFRAAASHNLDLGMTFDMGNWHWVGECALQAAQAFSSRVRYVHCKGVQRQPGRWVAVPLTDSSAPWRAILRAMPQDVPRAIEYPLSGDDLLAVTRNAIDELRNLEIES
ncbi:glutamine ABC transporter ATP-binding protein [Candidimonas sp. SYP-B2681]|uniref:sugar phosphate isomerase/epimerase family protein n=1 Tax=Candidimonas sp. SYP-B2681 TaxID=2497686 RepID=UPI000F85BCFE|nr:TIM barrel protein [Candidimonas sp. SYP-B2681]RTZ44531.1 glutamine ABC transporter ATP-binding protein [Candidimonas sp. SYP-B2681]